MPDEQTVQTEPTKDVQADWVAQGETKPDMPVAQPETPAETKPVAAPETQPAAVGQPRGPDGKFVAQETAQAVSPAPGQEFIEAQLADGTVFQVPKGLRLPLKRGAETVYEPVEEVQARGMFERDYRIKSGETAQQRRENEALRAQLEAEQARVQAREQWLAEQEAEMREAQKDPARWESYQQTLALYQTNPRFRQLMDDALAKRETDAVNEVYQRRDYESQVNEGVQLAADWIDQAAKEPSFAGVSADRVRVRYAQALAAGQATLDPGEVRALFEDEARYLTTSQTPLQQELAALKAQVEALQAAKGAEQHNAATAHALQRAKAPPVATRGTAPAVATSLPQGRFGPRDLPERTQAWIDQRD
jgi:hypothetical protein